ncbi:hypothetical protein KH388_22205 [Serratia rubidaea]|nr:hypothetical protein [Serratia rubidaea]
MNPSSAFWQVVSPAGEQWDMTLVSGVLCGALVFLLHSREPSRLRKLLYFGVSVVGGFAMTPVLQAAFGLPEWLTAFLSAAAVVTLAIIVLDWSESTVPSLLTQALQRLIGGAGGQQRPDDPGDGSKK